MSGKFSLSKRTKSLRSRYIRVCLPVFVVLLLDSTIFVFSSFFYFFVFSFFSIWGSFSILGKLGFTINSFGIWAKTTQLHSNKNITGSSLIVNMFVNLIFLSIEIQNHIHAIRVKYRYMYQQFSF